MKWLSRPFIGLLLAFFLMGHTDPYTEADPELYAEQERIKEYIKRSQELNKQPSPTGSPRAARLARNRYRNQLDPIYPKTIYPEVLPTGNYKRFYGGIPR
jgi:hypothetical protein